MYCLEKQSMLLISVIPAIISTVVSRSSASVEATSPPVPNLTSSCPSVPLPQVQMKERCLSQKLSISLRRIRASEYAADTTDNTSTSSFTAAAPASAPESAPGGAGLAAFPGSPPAAPAAADSSVSSCLLPDGRKLHLHDVIWGKVHGFPWWPGKVRTGRLGGDGRGGWKGRRDWRGQKTGT